MMQTSAFLFSKAIVFTEILIQSVLRSWESFPAFQYGLSQAHTEHIREAFKNLSLTKNDDLQLIFWNASALYFIDYIFSLRTCAKQQVTWAATLPPTLPPPPVTKPSYTKLKLCAKDDRKAQALLNSFNKTILLNKTKRSNDWSFT